MLTLYADFGDIDIEFKFLMRLQVFLVGQIIPLNNIFGFDFKFGGNSADTIATTDLIVHSTDNGLTVYHDIKALSLLLVTSIVGAISACAYCTRR